MPQGSHDFERLRAWAAMPDDKLEKLIDADTIAVMQRVMALIGGEGRSLPEDRADFVATVREMDRLYREGSRSLGEAIVEASEWGDKQDRARARRLRALPLRLPLQVSSRDRALSAAQARRGGVRP